MEKSQSSRSAKDRAISLFKYLEEFAKLRSRPVYDCENFLKVIWLADIPRAKECISGLWQEERRTGDQIWLEIQKPDICPLPELPEKLKPWVNQKELLDLSRFPDLPDLLEKIELPRSGDSASNSNDKEPAGFLELKDFPELTDLWLDYLGKEWEPWVRIRKIQEKIQKIYSELHYIYQRQTYLAETSELVLALGLLTWQIPDSQRIHRHLITYQASIELDGITGTLYVKPSSQGAQGKLEQDMLQEASQRPDNKTQESIEESLKDIEDYWKVDELLKQWIHSLSSTGIYSEDLKPAAQASADPIVNYSPALILRKRTSKGMQRVCSMIIEQLESGETVPHLIARIASSPGDERINETDLGQSAILSDGRIYFPLASNEEQEKIIDRLRAAQGVVVQGPPGTGKSHSIANLICHLLASGNRILVTSQTGRALKVLKKKLPDEIKDLCVSLLGSGQDDLKELEKSIQSIDQKYADWKKDKIEKEIERLQIELDRLKEKEAILQSQLRESRIKETVDYNICGGIYSGKAQDIAKRIASEKAKYGWMKAEFPKKDNSRPPLTNQEATHLLKLIRKLEAETIRISKDWYIPSTELAPLEDFKIAKNEEKSLSAQRSEFSEVIGSKTYSKLLHAPPEQLKSFGQCLINLLDKRADLLKHSQAWIKEALDDVFSRSNSRWGAILEKSNYLLSELSTLLTALDAKRNFLTRWLARKRIKEQVRIKMEELRTVWLPHTPRLQGVREEQMAQIQDNCRLLKEILDITELLEQCVKECNKINGLYPPNWIKIEELNRYEKTIRAAQLELAFRKAGMLFNEMATKLRPYLDNQPSNEIVRGFHEAAVTRDAELYTKASIRSVEIIESKNLFDEKDGLFKKLSHSLPELAHKIAKEPYRIEWDKMFSEFEEAWRWALAKNWLERYLSQLNEQDIEDQIINCEQGLHNIMEKLVALMSWQYCSGRLKENEDQRSHLVAWSKAIKRIGKGTGKFAEKHRRDARSHMEKCQSVIPVWIMPLYRVTESIQPERYAFDVIIIDEASQSGMDALILAYLGRKVLVVGDDEQISPEDVGVPREDVEMLKQKYIADFEHRDSIGVDSSFFDLSDIIFPNRIILQEHFRCMPEIIKFSSDLCYSHKPLKPLRQYPPDRLEPIKTCHVSNGYREGKFNKPEAEAIVQAISECCKDPKYNENTMGVISLLGEAQALLIQSRLLEEIGPTEMEKRRLICGDAYAFQGDERDIMFLSMVAVPEGLIALTKKEYRQRFNVAASRGKDQVWLFHTPTLNDFSNKECMRYRLLEYYQNYKRISSDEVREMRSKCESPFEREVYDKITARGYKVIPQHEETGYRIDLVIEGNKGRLAVECDGDRWHSEIEEQERDIRRQRILERCGWRFWRIRGSAFYLGPDQAMQGLWKELDSMHIYPFKGEDNDNKYIKHQDTQPKPDLNIKANDEIDDKASDIDEINTILKADPKRTDSDSASNGNSLLFEEPTIPPQTKKNMAATSYSSITVGKVSLKRGMELVASIIKDEKKVYANLRNIMNSARYSWPTKLGLNFAKSEVLDKLISLLGESENWDKSAGEKEIGRIEINNYKGWNGLDINISIVVHVGEDKNAKGQWYVDIREYMSSPNHSGITEKGIRFPMEMISDILGLFKKLNEELKSQQKADQN